MTDDAVSLRHDLIPGDIGWVLQSHAESYARDQGFDLKFEALVARILTDFALDHDAERERLWIAEQGGRRLGSIMLLHDGENDRGAVSRLRLFYVDAAGRGRGVGSRLIETCLGFARHLGYRSMVLDTVRELPAARRMYQRHGFRLLTSKPQREWSVDVNEETWRLDF